jgi:hypothetical protein
VTKLTEGSWQAALNEKPRMESGASRSRKDNPMLTAILTPLAIVVALAYALRAGRDGQAIIHRPYNNRYNDAPGARRDHLG